MSKDDELLRQVYKIGMTDGERGTPDNTFCASISPKLSAEYHRGYARGADEVLLSHEKRRIGIPVAILVVVGLVLAFSSCQRAEAMGSGDQARNCSAQADLIKAVATLRAKGYSPGQIQEVLAPTPPRSLAEDPAAWKSRHEQRKIVSSAVDIAFLQVDHNPQVLWQGSFDRCLDRAAVSAGAGK